MLFFWSVLEPESNYAVSHVLAGTLPNNLSPHCLKSPPNSQACQLLIKYTEAFLIAIKNVKYIFLRSITNETTGITGLELAQRVMITCCSSRGPGFGSKHPHLSASDPSVSAYMIHDIHLGKLPIHAK